MKLLSSILDEPIHLTYLLICCTTISMIIFEYKKQARLFKKGALKRITGPLEIPILGNIYQMTMSGRAKRMEQYVSLYQEWAHLKIGRVTIYDRLFIFYFIPEYLEALLGNVKLAKKPHEYKLLSDSPLGGGLISQPDVDIWRVHRKIITPTFHFNVLKTYIPVFHEETLVLIKILKEKLLKANESSKKIVVPDFRPFIQLSAFDMILRTAFGVNIQAQKNESHSFVNAMSEATTVVQQRLVKPWLLLEPLFYISGYKRRQEELKKICYDFTESVIRMKRLEYQRKQELLAASSNCTTNGSENKSSTCDLNGNIESPKKINGHTNNVNTKNPSDVIENNSIDHKQDTNDVDDGTSVIHKSFVELIIENEANEEEKMSDEELRDNMITLMFAGQDTTATTNSITLLMLSLHPKIQVETLEEIDSIFGGPGEDDGHVPTHSEIMQLHTLDRVIKETMRLYPAAPIFGRAITKDTPMGPYILPERCDVGIFLLGLHRDPNFHPKADEFWPDRFLPHNSGLIKNFSYIPFSAGSRNCLGQKYAMLQMKVVLSTILRKFRVSTDESIKCLKDVDDIIDVSVTLNMGICPLVFTSRTDVTDT